MAKPSESLEPITKQAYEAALPELRVALLKAQYELAERDFPVLVVISGIDAAGRSESINLLNEWMDARLIETHALGLPTDEERERPPLWRYWRAMPPRGRISIFYGGWYLDAIHGHNLDKIKKRGFRKLLEQAAQLERTLIDDGALIVKLWFDIDKQAMKQRLEDWEKDPTTSWRVGKKQWERYRDYDKLKATGEKVCEALESDAAKWTVIDGAAPYARELAVGKTLLAALRQRLDHPPSPPAAKPLPSLRDLPAVEPTLEGVDLSKRLDKKEYRERLSKYQGRLNKLGRKSHEQGHSSILVFQGWDAAGKGGAIRRITQVLDARQYRVFSIAAPTDEERAHHYLWRFWRRLPRAGRVTIFDRSWYGRVLVERVEGFASEAEWSRAYDEINDFESQLCDHGISLLKFWLHIDPEEQLRRFDARQETPYKRHKITEEDYRNREKWSQYETAIEEMFQRTSTAVAPWTLVEANDKRYARVKVLKTFCKKLEEDLQS